MIVWSFFIWFLLYNHMIEISSAEDDVLNMNSTDDLMNSRKYNLLDTSASLNKGSFSPITAFNKTVMKPWHVLEREYYNKNKKVLEAKYDLSRAVVTDVTALDERLRRLGAALEAESLRRKEQCAKLEEQIALLKGENSALKRNESITDESSDEPN